MVRDADAARDRADADVAAIDVPAVLALAVSAASEFGHAPMIPPVRPEGKPLGMVGRAARGTIGAWMVRRSLGPG